MSNSKLVEYTRISPNKNSPRNHAIDTITIHCMAGQASIETCGSLFADAGREASSNYGIDYDGRIGMYVEEKDRSWCSSNGANDNRAVTIEVASDSFHPYAVTEKAFAALLDLVTDICKRNGIKKLVWSINKSDRVNHKNGCNMTVHRDYANKACPGDYLYNRHGEIAAEVNKRLGSAEDQEQTAPATQDDAKPASGGALSVGDIVNFTGSTHYKSANAATGVPCKAGAARITQIYERGKHAYHLIAVKGGTSNVYGWVDRADIASSSGEIKVGSVVRLKEGATTYTGGSLASFVYKRDHVVKQIDGKRVVITFGGIVVAAVNADDLTLA